MSPNWAEKLFQTLREDVRHDKNNNQVCILPTAQISPHKSEDTKQLMALESWHWFKVWEEGQVQSYFVRATQLLTVGNQLQAWPDLSSPSASPRPQPPPSQTSSPPPSPPCWPPPSPSCRARSGQLSGFHGFGSPPETPDFLLAAPWNVSFMRGFIFD